MIESQTVKTALEHSTQRLAQRTDTPRMDAQLLLCATLGVTRSWLTAHSDAALDGEQTKQFFTLCERRAGGAPVPYLTGTAGFYGREFAVNDTVLIPRPETEHLIEATLAYLGGHSGGKGRVLDVGTGSGAIAVTMASELPEIAVDGTDISYEALCIARRNAERHGVDGRCTFYCGNLAEPVRANRYNAVIANLPYVPTDTLPALPQAVSFEPVRALDGGRDGLGVYRRLLATVGEVMSPRALLVMEAAPPTIALLQDLAARAFPDSRLESGVDLGGRARYVCVHQQVRH
ncbi:MAG: peptide chain release factor N(5)-glutamine methyltransferase [Candidatus Eremiobacteraeota bacterium]|nr:peptide chain release factor N(5)-glutamine methyltransferase [Candidatus Eremiobacteraeota bacterium]